MNSRMLPRLAIGVATAVLGLTNFALAGPPLICRAIEIGQAKTLPWVDLNFQKGNGYDLNNLTRDTLEILDSTPSVLVRMETLRRATIYARQDPQIAKELLVRLRARAENSNADSQGALAWFDVGYLTETYKQWIRTGASNPARGLDGYAWVTKAMRLRGSDPEMEFAAALITLPGPESEHRAHVQKAIAGAKSDPLLAQNLAANFARQTIAEVLAGPSRS